MATTTPNFGWSVPTSTDLVKDGATAIETLGDSVDASMADLLGGTSGQILAKNSNTNMDFVWITNDVGDITEVQAGTGISVASGTGPIPVVTNTVATAYDAKGDLIGGTGADTFARLAVGANDTVLTADSSTATGLKWAAPAAPSYAFASYTPTYVNFTLGNGTMSAEYAQIDKIVYVKGLLTLGSTSSVSGQIRISMPVNAAAGDMGVGYSPAFDIYAFDDGVGVWLLYGSLVNSSGTTTLSLSAQNASGTYTQTTALTSAIPFTWATNDKINFTAIYKAA